MAQLPESEFEVDPGLRDMVEAQIKQEEEALRQVCLLLLPVQISGQSQRQRLLLAFMYLAHVTLLLQHTQSAWWSSNQRQKYSVLCSVNSVFIPITLATSERTQIAIA